MIHKLFDKYMHQWLMVGDNQWSTLEVVVSLLENNTAFSAHEQRKNFGRAIMNQEPLPEPERPSSVRKVIGDSEDWRALLGVIRENNQLLKEMDDRIERGEGGDFHLLDAEDMAHDMTVLVEYMVEVASVRDLIGESTHYAALSEYEQQHHFFRPPGYRPRYMEDYALHRQEEESIRKEHACQKIFN